MASPLTKYQRQPKQSIDLPSKGKWYAPGTLESFTELEVYSMTASDEIATKTPDTLLSGNATASVIKNCIPSIKNPWEIPMTDVYTILSAIRMASYGDSISVNNTCTECSEENKYDVDLQNMIGHFSGGVFVDEFELDNVKFTLRPLNYKELNEINKFNFKCQRKLVQSIPLMEDEDVQAEATQQVYDELNNLKVSTVSTSVATIEINGEVEKNQNAISEFLKSSESKFYNKVEEMLIENNLAFAVPTTKTTCSTCGHEADLNIEMDYSNFFAQG
jgi:hypothetical protein